jgi:diguanylate cyclase (GGDEF)-like protein
MARSFAQVALRMDPFTVIVVLAIHLVGSGGLMFLVWRLMPDAPGLGRWWVASCLFGFAYAGRLVSGLDGVDWRGMVGDGLMLFAVLLFSDGLREFVRRTVPHWQVTALAWSLMFAGIVAATALGGAAARHVALNLCIGGMYAVLVWTIVFEISRQPVPLRAPLRLLAALVGGLSILTLLRALSIAVDRMQVAFKGTLAQVFYTYASLAAVVVALTLLWMLFLRLNGQLAELAARDSLTGVLNRQGLDDRVKNHFARRDASPLTVLLLDIDHFKRINDAFGHPTGDAVLKAVAGTLLSHLRAEDFVARVGGEEFLIACVGAQGDMALDLARRLNDSVGQLQVPAAHGTGTVACTVSVGMSCSLASPEDWEDGVRQADQALYRAKAEGRNGVRPFMPSMAVSL